MPDTQTPSSSPQPVPRNPTPMPARPCARRGPEVPTPQEPSVAAIPPPAWIQLLRYTTGSGRARAIGAVWRDECTLHWASPLARRFQGLFNPLPFLLCFADAQTERALFELALDWFDAQCFGARDLDELRAACEREPEWRLSCQSYPGNGSGADLAARLAMAPDWAAIDTVALRNAIFESVAHLVAHHAPLAGTALEPIHDATMEVGRLHLTEGRRARLLVHPTGGRSDASALALMADERLHRLGAPGDRALLVLPHLGEPRPLRVTRRVVSVGPEFSVIARGLLEIANEP